MYLAVAAACTTRIRGTDRKVNMIALSIKHSPFLSTRHGSACITRIRGKQGEVNKESGVGKC
jgi:hypothetical protein